MTDSARKIQKARADVAQSGARAPVPSEAEPYKPRMSPETMRALNEITAQMEEAVERVAPSESTSPSKLSDDKVYDELFKDATFPPPLGVASVARRKEVEGRCEDLRIDDLFVSGEIRQRVEIRPRRLEVVFRTLKSREDLYIKRRLNEVRNENARYAEDRFLHMFLCAHLHAYNGKALPSIFDENGTIRDELFDKRFAFMGDVPQLLLEEIWVNYRWFEDRVRRALEADNLKGG